MSLDACAIVVPERPNSFFSRFVLHDMLLFSSCYGATSFVCSILCYVTLCDVHAGLTLET
jgi:hypothetical protein